MAPVNCECKSMRNITLLTNISHVNFVLFIIKEKFLAIRNEIHR